MTALPVGVIALLARLATLGFTTDFLSKPILDRPSEQAAARSPAGDRING